MVFLKSNSASIPFNDRYFQTLPALSWPTDIAAAREIFHNQGVLRLRGVLEPDELFKVRKAYLASFQKKKKDNPSVPHGLPGHPAYDFVQTQTFQDFSDHPKLQSIASALLGKPVRRLKRTPVRHFSHTQPMASRAHVDLTYLDEGTDNVVTFWVSLGDCPLQSGGLVYLKDSSGLDAAELQPHLPTDRPDDCRPITHDLQALSDLTGQPWLYADIKAGDVFAHGPRIIHASVNNTTEDWMRISLDIRFMQDGEDADPRWSDNWRGDDGY